MRKSGLAGATRDRNQVPRRGLTDVVRGLTDVVYGGTRRARHPCCPREASASACPWPPGEITLQSRLHRAGKISTYRVLELAQVPEILVSIPEYFRRRVQLRGGFPRMRQALRGLTSTRPMAFPFRPGSAGHSG